jgi:hypothetical protein
MEQLTLMRVRYQVLTTTNKPVKMADFWTVAPCSLLDVDRHLRHAYYLHLQGEEA